MNVCEDDLFLLGMIAATAAEALAKTEDDEWECLLCCFAAGYRDAHYASARVAVLDEEQRARFELRIHENCVRNALDIRWRLRQFGATREVEETFRPVSEAAESEVDTSWRSMPTILPRDESPMRLGTLAELRVELESECAGGGGGFARAAAAVACARTAAVEAREEWARDDIASEERLTRSRREAQCVRFIAQLHALEGEVAAERDVIAMHRMNDEERLQYRLRPAIQGERAARAALLLSEREGFRRICLGCLEGIARGVTHERFRGRWAELFAERAAARLALLQGIARRALAGPCLRRWAWGVVRRRRLAAGRAGLPAFAHVIWCGVVRRYAASWNARPTARRVAAQQRDVLEAQEAAHRELVVGEAEELQRNILALAERSVAAQLAEAFFVEREAAQRVWQRRVATELVTRSAHRHMLRRLVVWHRVWKLASMRRKARWLLTIVERAALTRRFAPWLSLTHRRAGQRAARWGVVAAARVEKECILIVATEKLQRALLAELEEDAERAVLARAVSSHYIGARQRHCERIAALIGSDIAQVQRQFRFHVWAAFVQLRRAQRHCVRLLATTERMVRCMCYDKWSRLTALRQRRGEDLLLEALSARAKMALDAAEVSARLAVEEREDWARCRREFRFAAALRPDARRAVDFAVEDLERRSRCVHQHLRWRTFVRFFGHRRHMQQSVVVVEHMEYEAELILMSRCIQTLARFREASQTQKRVTQAQARFKAEVDELEAEMGTLRSVTEEEEQWGFTRIQLAHARSIKTLRAAFQKGIVRVMAIEAARELQRRYLAVLTRLVARRRRLHDWEADATEMERRCAAHLLRRFTSAWRRFWWVSMRPKLAVDLESRHHRKLLRRYYHQLAPVAVRRARIARARESLAQAHAAARLLERGPLAGASSAASALTDTSTASIRVLKPSRRSFLPPLLRRGLVAAAHKAGPGP